MLNENAAKQAKRATPNRVTGDQTSGTLDSKESLFGVNIANRLLLMPNVGD